MVTASVARGLRLCIKVRWLNPFIIQAAEAAVGLIVKAGRPIQKIGSAEGGAIAEEDGP